MSENDISCCLLHRHTTYSVYDGCGLPRDAAKYAKELGMTHLAITDHGIMTGVADHYFACLAEGITPILGCEAYHQPKFEPTKEAKRYHLTLLAKNIDGYYNLSEMQSQANMNFKYSTYPICDFDLLEKYANGIICLSGCVLSCLNQMIIQDRFDEAKLYTERFLDIFKENFYFEVQPQEFADQKKANLGILELAKIFNRPVAMTSDSHFVRPEDLDSYVILRQMNYKSRMPTPEQIAKKKEREAKKAEKAALQGIVLEQKEEEKLESDDMFKVDLDNFAESIRSQYGKLYMPSGRELADRWRDFMCSDGIEYVRESQRIADLCKVELNFHEMVPQAIVEVDPATQKPIPSKKVLAREVRKFLNQSGWWNVTSAREAIDENGVKKIERYYPYRERAIYELNRILSKKMEDYFLLVADLVNEARRRGIEVGPGRGSAGASLIARSLGITEFDPVHHDCMFDRFLPESRMNLPDIDTDFGSRREELKSYLLQKYNGQCAEIANFNRLTKDVLLNDLARVLDISTEDLEYMKSAILAFGIGGKDKEAYPEYAKLMTNRQLSIFDAKYNRVIKHFCTLYGSVRTLSKHASGVAVSSGNLSQYSPLFVRGGEIYTSYDKKKLEDLGIVKLDVLKVDALYALQIMCRLAGINRLDIPENDKETFKAFQNLDVTGIFQFESPGAQTILRQIHPESIIDLAVATGLNRPGGMEMGALEVYLEAKKGNIDMTSRVAQCCKDTYGAFIFQEHALIACKNIGHMSDKGSIKMMKKLHGQIPREDPLVQEFIAGAVKYEGMTEDETWDFIKRITSYTFNKAHAIAYVLISYWLMYMKIHYPFEFYLASLQVENDANKRKRLEADAFNHKDENGNRVIVLLPHVNGPSEYHEVKQGEKRFIRAGIQVIDKVGGVAAKAIEREWKEKGDFKDEEDMLKRVNGTREVSKGRGDKKVITIEFNKSPIKTDTLLALREAGAVEFDKKEYTRRCGEYLGSIVHAKKRRWA